jgi:hypothetical protein
MDWNSAVTGLDFLGWSSIEDLQVCCDAIPEAAGIYILRRLQPTPIAFLAANPGGRFKDATRRFPFRGSKSAGYPPPTSPTSEKRAATTSAQLFVRGFAPSCSSV